MFWDGLLHTFTWISTAVAICMLWRAINQGAPLAGRVCFGAALLGWGIFNVVEGVIDHEILQIHHVYQNGPHLAWDLAFLAFGALLMLGGSMMIRGGLRQPI